MYSHKRMYFVLTVFDHYVTYVMATVGGTDRQSLLTIYYVLLNDKRI